MEPRVQIGSGADFYARQKSPIYNRDGQVTGYDHGYGNVETFDKPIPRDQYTGPGPSMGESRGNIFKDNFPIGWCLLQTCKFCCQINLKNLQENYK